MLINREEIAATSLLEALGELAGWSLAAAVIILLIRIALWIIIFFHM